MKGPNRSGAARPIYFPMARDSGLDMPKESRTWFDPPDGTAEEEMICTGSSINFIYSSSGHGGPGAIFDVSQACVSQSQNVLF